MTYFHRLSFSVVDKDLYTLTPTSTLLLSLDIKDQMMGLYRNEIMHLNFTSKSTRGD